MVFPVRAAFRPASVVGIEGNYTRWQHSQMLLGEAPPERQLRSGRQVQAAPNPAAGQQPSLPRYLQTLLQLGDAAGASGGGLPSDVWMIYNGFQDLSLMVRTAGARGQHGSRQHWG